MRADLVIRGGLVADGSGGDMVEADVAVRDGRVVAVERGADGDRVVDAAGAIVAPGFIDVHTHYDAQVTWDPWVTPSSSLGVTSVVAGNCGFSLAPCRAEHRPLMMRTLEAVEDMLYDTLDSGVAWDFESYPEYVDALRGRGLGVNFGSYVGHTAVRLWVMGEDAYERAATPAEIGAMAGVVTAAVRAGAVGFSTDRAGFLKGDGGRAIPSVVASVEETEALAGAVAAAGRGIVHVAPGDDWFRWAVLELAPKLGCTLTWSAILAFPTPEGTEAMWRRKLACHLEGRERGIDAHPQVTSRVLSFQFTLENPLMLYRYPSFGDLGRSLSVEERSRRFDDPAWRAAARAEMGDGTAAWSGIVIAETGQAGQAERAVADVAAERGVHPLDAALDVALADRLATRFRVDVANVDPAAVTTLLTAPGAVLGLSDAGAHVGQLCDAVMPLDFLGAWVRDRGVMRPEDGLRKLSGELADLLGLADRGYVRPGQWADLVVLDWDRVDPGPARRVADLPGGGERLVADRPGGLRHVLVNGVPIRLDERDVRPPQGPGRLLTAGS